MISVTDIIKEAAKTETLVDNHLDLTGVISAELKAKYAEYAKCIPVIDKGVVTYEAVMIPVFGEEGSYVVEMENVTRYMESNDIKNIKEAMDNIAEANEISVDELSLVLGSKAEFEKQIEEAEELLEKEDNDILVENCELTFKLISTLESVGINVVFTN